MGLGVWGWGSNVSGLRFRVQDLKFRVCGRKVAGFLGSRTWSGTTIATTYFSNELPYRGILLTRKRTPPGPYRRPMPKVPRGSKGGGAFSYGRGTHVHPIFSGEDLVRDDDGDHIVLEGVAGHPIFTPDSPEKNLPPNLREGWEFYPRTCGGNELRGVGGATNVL